jgi:hypothetical protein
MSSIKSTLLTAAASVMAALVGFTVSPFVDSWQIYVKSPPVETGFSMYQPYFYRSTIIHPSATAKNDKMVYHAYFIDFGVKNRSGWTSAEQCRIFVTSIRRRQADGKLTDNPSFVPVRMQTQARFKVNPLYPPDIAPEMELMAGLVYIPELNFQKAYPDTSGAKDIVNMQLSFDETGAPNWVESHLDPGTHEVTVKIYFKNRKPLTRTFEIVWEGGWADSLEEMKKKVKVRIVPDAS